MQSQMWRVFPRSHPGLGTIEAFVLALVLCAGTAFADQIVLKNGDRVTGEIQKKDGNTLTIKSDLFGVITVDWDKVESVNSSTPLNVTLPGGRTVQSSLGASGAEIELKEAQQRVPPAEILTIRNAEAQRAYERVLNPGWMDLWSGTATLGFAGTQGNAQTKTFTTTFGASRVTNSDKTAIYFNAIKASALIDRVSASTAQAVRGGWFYSHNVSSRVFLNGFNDYEYDRFQNLDLRFVLGGGLGFTVMKTESGRLDLLAGVAYNREKFSPAAPAVEFTRNSAEAYWGDDYTFKLNSATSLFQSFRMFNNLSHTGDYRMNFDLGATTKLTRWLNWSLGFSDRFLSNPVVGRKKNDFLYTTGIGVTFAR